MTILDDLTVTQAAPDLRRAAAELRRLKEEVSRGPDPAATRRQHDKNKLTAHERLELLFDEGTFTEIEPLRRTGPPASVWRSASRTATAS